MAKRVGNPALTTKGAIRTAAIAEKSLKVEVVESFFEEFNPGDILVIKKYTGDDFDNEGEEVIFISKDDILARGGNI